MRITCKNNDGIAIIYVDGMPYMEIRWDHLARRYRIYEYGTNILVTSRSSMEACLGYIAEYLRKSESQ